METNQGVRDASGDVRDETKTIENEDLAGLKRNADKLKAQRIKDAEEKADLKAQLESYKRSESEREEELLRKSGEFEKLIALRDQRDKESQNKLELERKLRVDAESKIEQTWKLQAFYSKLPGTIDKREYLAHAQLDDIIFDKDSMTCDDQSVEAVVNKFMEDHSKLVTPKQAKKLPSNATNTSMSIKDIGKTNDPRELLRKGLSGIIK